MTPRIKTAIAWPLFLLIALLLVSRFARCEDKFEWLYSPVYSPKQPLIWNASKLAGYAAGSLDAHSTTAGLRRGGCYESNMLDNIFIGKRDPAPVGRQAVALGLQYGFNSLLDWGWRRSTTKKEKFALIAVRGGLTALSMWAWNHNRRLNANRN